MSVLSIMIDEAGNFDRSVGADSLYCIALVFHNQDDDITKAIAGFERAQRTMGFDPSNPVHINPLIRKKPPYEELDKSIRKSLFSSTATFIEHLPIKFETFLFDKKESGSYNELISRMISRVNTFIYNNLSFFQKFETIRLYYDKGQKEVSLLLESTFSTIFPYTEMRVASQKDYKLLQVADYICTLEYIREKWDRGKPTASAINFFGTRRVFLLNFYNQLKRFRL